MMGYYCTCGKDQLLYPVQCVRKKVTWIFLIEIIIFCWPLRKVFCVNALPFERVDRFAPNFVC